MGPLATLAHFTDSEAWKLPGLFVIVALAALIIVALSLHTSSIKLYSLCTTTTACVRWCNEALACNLGKGMPTGLRDLYRHAVLCYAVLC